VPQAIPDGAILKVPGGRERLGTNWIRHGENGLPIPVSKLTVFLLTNSYPTTGFHPYTSVFI